MLTLPDGFQTARLLPRPIAPEDSGPIFDTYAQDQEVTRYLSWRPHRSRADTDAYIARCVAAAEPTYVLTNRTDGTVLGLSICVSRRRTAWSLVMCWPAAGGARAS